MMQCTLLDKRFEWNGNGGSLNVSDEAWEVFDGVMLSDGYLYLNSTTYVFGIGLTEKSIEWLNYIKKKLGFLGHGHINKSASQKNKIKNKIAKFRPSVRWTVGNKKILSMEYKRWYSNGKKIVPRDVRLTPMSLANWYMGDGYLNQFSNYYTIGMSTNGFIREDISFLKKRLEEEFDFDFRIYHSTSSGLVMHLNRQRQVYEFLKMTEPYKVGCFDYKWRALYDEEWVKKWGD